LTEIDAVLQEPFVPWLCGPDGTPLPPPTAPVLGRNSFVSLYEITTDPIVGGESYDLTTSGSLLSVARFLEQDVPPDCDTGEPGFIHFLVLPGRQDQFSSVLHLIVPAPGAVAAGSSALLLFRRRRATRTT